MGPEQKCLHFTAFGVVLPAGGIMAKKAENTGLIPKRILDTIEDGLARRLGC
jgi:hypothetical protein